MNDFTGRRILVVDDEAPNRRLIQAILAPEGPVIVHAPDGATALSILLEQEIDLVLLDVMMPGIDGIEVCRRIRDRSRSGYVPVVLVSAVADGNSRARGKDAGADDFLSKPVHEDELLARCRNLLRMRAYQMLVQRQHRDAEREARRWRLMSEVAGAVAVCRDYDHLLGQISAALSPHLPIDCAAVLVVEDDDLLLRGVWSNRERRPVPQPKLAWDAAAWTDRMRGAKALRLCAADADAAPLGPLVDALGFRDAIAIPVFGAGALHGMLVVARERAVSADDVTVFEQLAPHIGNAVNNVRLHLRAEQLLRAREELTQLIVHDLRNPLTAAQTNIELALEPDVDPEDRDAGLSDAHRAIQRLVAMVSDLLDTSAAEAGRLRLHRRVVELPQLARGVIDQMPIHLATHRVELVSAADVQAPVDAKLFCRVLENIIGNATRFVPRHGRIAIAIRRDATDAVIEVSNDGPSITPELRARLFQKYAGESSTGRTRGLGLYFCRLVAEAHGGTIRETAPPSGVCFELRLPLAEPASAAA